MARAARSGPGQHRYAFALQGANQGVFRAAEGETDQRAVRCGSTIFLIDIRLRFHQFPGFFIHVFRRHPHALPIRAPRHGRSPRK